MDNIIYFLHLISHRCYRVQKSFQPSSCQENLSIKPYFLFLCLKWRVQEIGGIQLVSLFATLFLQNIVEEWLLVFNYRYFLDRSKVTAFNKK